MAASDWSEDDDARELRSRLQAIEDAIAALPETYAEGEVALFGYTKQVTTYPTTPGSFVVVEVYAVGGDEVEGNTPTTDDTAFSVPCICPGTIPAVGSPVTAKKIGGYFFI